ncbi:hypothetical protein BIY45_00875 [Stenotrophomonas sp. BIIR7]|uniref:DUF4189 domain-containing protein n=1 Tax=Stenotrophomonas bentonitica TaxID=1450134 RepID=UPI0008932703|nr:hypothetical protein BIY45_00875 [Stenotrophomonas sp. BIIR7]
MSGELMRAPLILLLLLASFGALAEGGCPPGQYPIGGQGVQGCAPIPGSGSGSGESVAPRPTGKWETRWGALAEDASANERGVVVATGVAESRKSKGEASRIALEQCRSGGGLKCKVLTTYYNQCIAVVDPKPKSQGGSGGRSVIYTAKSADIATAEAMKRCSPDGADACSIIYSACSMSEFRSFR